MVAGCGDDQPPLEAPTRGSPGDVAELARDYVHAFSDKDGERVCELFHPQVRKWIERRFLAGQRGYGCANTVKAYIGRVEDNPQTPWLGAKVTRVSGVTGHGALATVVLTLRHRYESRPPVKPEKEFLHFVRHGGDWKLAKPGRIFFRAINAYNLPEGVLDPPADPTALDAPLDLPGPTFACRGRAQTLKDARDDVSWYDDPAGTRRPSDAPWIDIRRATVRKDGREACIVIELAGPPRRTSTYHWAFEEAAQRRGFHTPRRVGLRIDGTGQPHALGRAELSGATAAATTPPQFGVHGNEIHLKLTSQTRPRWLRWSVLARSLQDEEPILPDPIRGEDEVPDPARGGPRLPKQ